MRVKGEQWCSPQDGGAQKGPGGGWEPWPTRMLGLGPGRVQKGLGGDGAVTCVLLATGHQQ